MVENHTAEFNKKKITTIDQLTATRGRDTEHRQPHNSKIKSEIKQLAISPQRDDCKTPDVCLLL